jgi:hypothetical protein
MRPQYEARRTGVRPQGLRALLDKGPLASLWSSLHVEEFIACSPNHGRFPKGGFGSSSSGSAIGVGENTISRSFALPSPLTFTLEDSSIRSRYRTPYPQFPSPDSLLISRQVANNQIIIERPFIPSGTRRHPAPRVSFWRGLRREGAPSTLRR